jgi:hypothetical protein
MEIVRNESGQCAVRLTHKEVGLPPGFDTIQFVADHLKDELVRLGIEIPAAEDDSAEERNQLLAGVIIDDEGYLITSENLDERHCAVLVRHFDWGPIAAKKAEPRDTTVAISKLAVVPPCGHRFAVTGEVWSEELRAGVPCERHAPDLGVAMALLMTMMRSMETKKTPPNWRRDEH